MIKNILLDFGGVLIDADLEAAIGAFRHLGMEDVSQYLNLYRQNDIFLGVEEGGLTKTEFNDRFREKVGRSVSDESIEKAWLAIVKEVNVEKLKWIETHRREFRFYLLSNINPYVFEWADTCGFSELGKPITHYFDKIFASYQIGMTKPGDEIFEYVIDNAPLLPAETLFIDDGVRNAEAGRKFGFHVYQPQNGENWIPVAEKIIEDEK